MVRILRPRDGWRAFAGEVGVIVLGVLIALAANEGVESLHWRDEVADFRTSLDGEIAFDLAALDFLLPQRECVERRLDELDRWRADQAAGIHRPLDGPIGRTVSIGFNTSIWNSRTGETMAHMPAQTRAGYADFYDTLSLSETAGSDLGKNWDDLAAFNHATTLSVDHQMRLDDLIQRTRRVFSRFEGHRSWMREQTQRSLAIAPGFGDFSSSIARFRETLAKGEMCKPIYPANGDS